MRVGEKAIMSAVATVIREQRDAQANVNAELREHIERLETRLGELEQRAPGRSLRAVVGESNYP